MDSIVYQQFFRPCCPWGRKTIALSMTQRDWLTSNDNGKCLIHLLITLLKILSSDYIILFIYIVNMILFKWYYLNSKIAWLGKAISGVCCWGRISRTLRATIRSAARMTTKTLINRMNLGLEEILPWAPCHVVFVMYQVFSLKPQDAGGSGGHRKAQNCGFIGFLGSSNS